MKKILFILLLALQPVGLIAGSSPAPVLQTSLRDTRPLEPYILIGESGKSVERTAKELIGRLFMRNIEIVGKYHPAGDSNRYVIVVTDPNLLAVAGSSKETAGYLAAMRIAITRVGELTYVSCQEPEYWAHAYLQEDYSAVAGQLAIFRRKLLRAMPKMRGRFMRPYGGSAARPMTPAKLRTYHYRRRTESLEDLITLATFGSFEEAVAAMQTGLEALSNLEAVFEVAVPGKQVRLYGISLEGDRGEQEILNLLEIDRFRHTGALPYELLVTGNQVVMLPIRYRLPLNSPSMTKKTFRKLKTYQEEITRKMAGLVQ